MVDDEQLKMRSSNRFQLLSVQFGISCDHKDRPRRLNDLKERPQWPKRVGPRAQREGPKGARGEALGPEGPRGWPRTTQGGPKGPKGLQMSETAAANLFSHIQR